MTRYQAIRHAALGQYEPSEPLDGALTPNEEAHVERARRAPVGTKAMPAELRHRVGCEGGMTYAGYSELATGYHAWRCASSEECLVTMIMPCAVLLGGHGKCVVCEVVGYEFS